MSTYDQNNRPRHTTPAQSTSKGSSTRAVTAEYKVRDALRMRQQSRFHDSYDRTVEALETLGFVHSATSDPTEGKRLLGNLRNKIISRELVNGIRGFVGTLSPEESLVASQALGMIGRSLIKSDLSYEGALVLETAVLANPKNEESVRDFSDIVIKLRKEIPTDLPFSLSEKVQMWKSALSACTHYLAEARGINEETLQSKSFTLLDNERVYGAWILGNAAQLALFLGRWNKENKNKEEAISSLKKSILFGFAAGVALGLPVNPSEWRVAIINDHLTYGAEAFYRRTRTLVVTLGVIGDAALELRHGTEAFILHGLALGLDGGYPISRRGLERAVAEFPEQVRATEERLGERRRWFEKRIPQKQRVEPAPAASPNNIPITPEPSPVAAETTAPAPIETSPEESPNVIEKGEKLEGPQWAEIVSAQAITLESKITELVHRTLEKREVDAFMGESAEARIQECVAMRRSRDPHAFKAFIAEKSEFAAVFADEATVEPMVYLEFMALQSLLEEAKPVIQKHVPSLFPAIQNLHGQVAATIRRASSDPDWIMVGGSVKKGFDEVFGLAQILQLSS